MVSDTYAGCSRAKDHQSHIRKLQFTNMQSAHDRSQCNASSTLYIVIETSELGPVVVKDPSSIAQAEVFTGGTLTGGVVYKLC